MPQPENSEQPQQRFCRNCGAEVRQGSKFCVSCGVSLNPEPSGSSEAHSVPPPPTPPPSKSVTDTLEEAMLRLTRRFSNVSSGSGGTTGNGVSNRVVNWFRDLASVPKLILVGIVLLLLFTVLSPLAFIVAALLFVVSIIALIIRRTQRGSVKGWGIVAVASFVSLFIFGGILVAFYGGSTPDFQVVFEDSTRNKLGSSKVLIVSTSSFDEDQLKPIGNAMYTKTLNYDAADVIVYDRDEATFRDGKGIRSQDTGDLYPGDVYHIQIAHTPAGERINGVKSGRSDTEITPGPGHPESKIGGSMGGSIR